MNTNTQLETIAKATKPPLTRNQVLEATALAMERRSRDENKKANDERSKIGQERLSACKEYGLKHIKSAVVGLEVWGGLKVEFKVAVPDDIDKPFRDKLAKVAIPQIRTAKELLKELKEKQTPSVNIESLLSDPKMCDALIKAGTKLLLS